MPPACEGTQNPCLDCSSQAVDLYAGITIGSIQNVMGVLYSSTNYQGMFNLQNVLPVVGYERSVFYRLVTPKPKRPQSLCHPHKARRGSVWAAVNSIACSMLALFLPVASGGYYMACASNPKSSATLHAAHCMKSSYFQRHTPDTLGERSSSSLSSASHCLSDVFTSTAI
jgi:hypothetical protein